MKAARITLVLARARNGVIGRDGGLPWRLSSDLKAFKTYTQDKPVLMGRKTWASLPRRPLARRDNIVLTRDCAFRAEGGFTFSALDAALAAGRAMAASRGIDEICVIGGAEIYRQSLPFADRIRVTEVALACDGDVALDDIEESEWREVERREHEAGPGDDAPYTIRILERA